MDGNSKNRFPFLKLPAELRNHIYHLIQPNDSRIDIWCSCSSPRPYSTRTSRLAEKITKRAESETRRPLYVSQIPPIAQTCGQLRVEFLRARYGFNNIYLCCQCQKSKIKEWLRHVQNYHCHFSHVEIEGRYGVVKCFVGNAGSSSILYQQEYWHEEEYDTYSRGIINVECSPGADMANAIGLKLASLVLEILHAA